MKKAKLTKKQKMGLPLNPHQWRLYKYLENVMLNENNRTMTVSELVAAFPLSEDYPDGYILKETDGNHSNCPKLYDDLKAITTSFQVDMIVCLNHNQIRLGTEKDVLKRLLSLKLRSAWEEEEIRRIERKIKNNRQMKLLSNAGIPMNEAAPTTKAWHVAFSNENIALTIKQLEQEERENAKRSQATN